MTKPIKHPRPGVDWETRAYWEGCGRHELILQRCRSCGTLQHRPRALCVSCLSDEIEHFPASGRGTVYSFTVTHQNQAPGFREALPYVLAYVELEEGVRLLTNIVGCSPENVRIGLPVEVEYAQLEGDIAVPRFHPL
ncbi:MAG: Zn-ribbon domain-containing OB-fold protein [Deltaproteobacteria bacterium]|nr:Zn-ribbon domain-containing OB-fold protein [Myxococcales bacterium]MCZ6571197.1 Zn-ribbon domain-containing OB-fold protein [Deltaproteobacteria bacterium]MCZ6823891.1 Zn-ribbon domain-containing OB-fold protein [Deltaproteobacteria bacterium]TDJ02875.1 MAG: Zn-ribbon domain-containing OB-fold protein [Deltaproteobacteria bacterium]TDJ06761.1 MAG: Zn-ribbon domain-containing OB-fold protein [Deltaproteobacteria bacterium]